MSPILIGRSKSKINPQTKLLITVCQILTGLKAKKLHAACGVQITTQVVGGVDQILSSLPVDSW
jgi:hypothetical protein